MATTAKPNAIEIPSNPAPLGPTWAFPEITASPQPNNTRVNVPINSAKYFFVENGFD
jgi:hypothetical protein